MHDDGDFLYLSTFLVPKSFVNFNRLCPVPVSKLYKLSFFVGSLYLNYLREFYLCGQRPNIIIIIPILHIIWSIVHRLGYHLSTR